MEDGSRLAALCAALDYRFRREELLDWALTHPSALPGGGRRRGIPYERLEFLGDRVLGLAVADMLFKSFPQENEGALARRHAALVRREAVARIASALGLDRVLILSKGEEESGGRENPTVLGDACEAVLGAVYVDGGLAAAAAIVERLWTPLMDEAVRPPKDAKTALQEWAQGSGRPLPVYEIMGREGPAHAPNFQVAVSVPGYEPAIGSGTSKRAAEQAAATALLEKARG